MTALTPGYFDMMAAPLRIGAVTLKVRDLYRMSEFYQKVMGLEVISQDTKETKLGVAGDVLLVLQGDPKLRVLDPRQAGLFHTAFLLPTRADLGRWLGYVAQNRIPMQGASDHLVSEALYLADPEGNGIEVYIDRPTSAWHNAKGNIQMSTDPLDLDSLFEAAGDSRWQGFPKGGMVGHVHLQVGSTEMADPFYQKLLGFDITVHYSGANFYGSGGYHHQLAGNIWNSRGAGMRPTDMAGLGSLELIARDAHVEEAIFARAETAGLALEHREGKTLLQDPWGTQLILSL